MSFERSERAPRGTRLLILRRRSKFINALRAEGSDVEMYVVTGDIKDTRFQNFGGIVTELFYRADLSIFM